MAENTHNEQKWETMISISDNAQQRVENAELKTKLQKEQEATKALSSELELEQALVKQLKQQN